MQKLNCGDLPKSIITQKFDSQNSRNPRNVLRQNDETTSLSCLELRCQSLISLPLLRPCVITYNHLSSRLKIYFRKFKC